jgi:hypothetical protein
MKTLEDDISRCALSPEEAKDRGLWRGRSHGAKQPTRVKLDIPSMFFTSGNAVKPTCVYVRLFLHVLKCVAQIF